MKYAFRAVLVEVFYFMVPEIYFMVFMKKTW